MNMITDDPQSKRVQAVFLRAHCRLMAAGMSHSTMSKTEVLSKAGEITGKIYKRGQHEIAYNDLKAWLGENP